MDPQYEQYVRQIISNWQPIQQQCAMETMTKYGLPQEATESQMVWHNNGPWKRTVITREFYHHNWPVPHPDILANTIDYHVPVDMIEAVQRYDGSSYPHRTKGELTVNCDKEEHNIMSFNMVHEIVQGKRTPEDAKRFYTETFERYYRDGIPSPYMERLLFEPQTNTGDPDRAMTDVMPPNIREAYAPSLM